MRINHKMKFKALNNFLSKKELNVKYTLVKNKFKAYRKQKIKIKNYINIKMQGLNIFIIL